MINNDFSLKSKKPDLKEELKQLEKDKEDLEFQFKNLEKEHNDDQCNIYHNYGEKK